MCVCVCVCVCVCGVCGVGNHNISIFNLHLQTSFSDTFSLTPNCTPTHNTLAYPSIGVGNVSQLTALRYGIRQYGNLGILYGKNYYHYDPTPTHVHIHIITLLYTITHVCVVWVVMCVCGWYMCVCVCVGGWVVRTEPDARNDTSASRETVIMITHENMSNDCCCRYTAFL